MQQPQAAGRQGEPRVEQVAVVGEDEQRVLGVDQRQEFGEAGVAEVPRGRCGWARAAGTGWGGGARGGGPPAVAAHLVGAAVGGDAPAHDLVVAVADDGQDDVDAVRVGVEAQPGPGGLLPPGAAGAAGGGHAPGGGLFQGLAGGGEEARGQAHGAAVGVGVVAEPVEQVQAAVDDLQGVVAALGDEPARGHVEAVEAVPPGHGPVVEGGRVQSGGAHAALQQQGEHVAQAVGGDARVHEDRRDVGQVLVGEGVQAEPCRASRKALPQAA